MNQPRVEVFRAAAAGGQGRPAGDVLGDIALDPVPLAARGQRAHLCLRVERVADPDLGERASQRLDELIVTPPGDHGPGQRGTDLPGQEALGLGEGSRRGRDVHVVEDHGGRFAP